MPLHLFGKLIALIPEKGSCNNIVPENGGLGFTWRWKTKEITGGMNLKIQRQRNQKVAIDKFSF